MLGHRLRRCPSIKPAIDQRLVFAELLCNNLTFIVSAKAEKSFYTLDDQVDHKINFISQYVPVSVKLILVGHSIGCYIILKMLERLHATRVLKCVLLFPVIERLSVTNQGRVFSQLLKYFRWYTPAVTYPLGQLVPVSVKQSLIRWYLGSETEDFVIKATSKFINYTVLHNHVNLAHLELKHLHEADHEVIQRNIDKLMMYYGTSDRWCPVSYYEDMIRIYPDADIRLCQRDIQHAFVLRDSTQMADIVWQWLCERLPTLCEDNWSFQRGEGLYTSESDV